MNIEQAICRYGIRSGKPWNGINQSTDQENSSEKQENYVEWVWKENDTFIISKDSYTIFPQFNHLSCSFAFFCLHKNTKISFEFRKWFANKHTHASYILIFFQWNGNGETHFTYFLINIRMMLPQFCCCSS